MKRVVLVHGWAGTPEHGWFPWIKKELESRGFSVSAPQLPETEEPLPERWVPALAAAVGTPDEETYFIGHSMGCITIARYLETLETKVGGVVYVAGFFKRLTNLSSKEEEEITEAWVSKELNYEKVKTISQKSVAIFSDNDEWVPLDNIDAFRDQLGSEIILVSNAGHFTEDGGCLELPTALEAVLKLAS